MTLRLKKNPKSNPTLNYLFGLSKKTNMKAWLLSMRITAKRNFGECAYEHGFANRDIPQNII